MQAHTNEMYICTEARMKLPHSGYYDDMNFNFAIYSAVGTHFATDTSLPQAFS